MFRKLFSVVAVLAVLPLLTAGAVQARPLAVHPAAPAGVLQEVWYWAASSLASLGVKAGGEMDPNGHKARRIPFTRGGEANPDRTAGRAD